MLGQRHDVRHAIPQWREGDWDDVQAVVEVSPEPALVDQTQQVAMRRGDDAHIHRLRPAADRGDDTLLGLCG